MLRSWFPIAVEGFFPARENRLIMRVLDVWRRACGDKLLPLCTDLAALDAGEDAMHVFTIDLQHPKGPCFCQIGTGIRAINWPMDEEALVAACPKDTVLGIVSRHWREVVERGVPVTRGGIGVNGGSPVIYRGIMMPLADQNANIVAIMGAANWRTVEESRQVHDRRNSILLR